MLLAATMLLALLHAAPAAANAQDSDCPADEVTNSFVPSGFDDELYPDCIEFVVADGPDRLYGVDRPEGDPLGPWIIAVSIERQTSHRLPALAHGILPADFLPVPGVWGENRVAHTATARWIEPSGLYTLTINTDVVDLSLQEVAARLMVLDPVPPATGSGLMHEKAGDDPFALTALAIATCTVGVTLLMLYLRKCSRPMAH